MRLGVSVFDTNLAVRNFKDFLAHINPFTAPVSALKDLRAFYAQVHNDLDPETKAKAQHAIVQMEQANSGGIFGSIANITNALLVGGIVYVGFQLYKDAKRK